MSGGSSIAFGFLRVVGLPAPVLFEGLPYAPPTQSSHTAFPPSKSGVPLYVAFHSVGADIMKLWVIGYYEVLRFTL